MRALLIILLGVIVISSSEAQITNHNRSCYVKPMNLQPQRSGLEKVQLTILATVVFATPLYLEATTNSTNIYSNGIVAVSSVGFAIVSVGTIELIKIIKRRKH